MHSFDTVLALVLAAILSAVVVNAAPIDMGDANANSAFTDGINAIIGALTNMASPTQLLANLPMIISSLTSLASKLFM
ncbi:hypothetical protein GQ42DRAFT_160929, partial [Ramicandelaber brevisporus]